MSRRQNVMAKGEKNSGVSNGYVVRPLATAVRGKPAPPVQAFGQHRRARQS